MSQTRQSESEHITVYEPFEDEGDAGLAVSYHPDPGPHGTKFTVDQLWPEEGEIKAEPVYIGDEQRVVSLIEALAEAVQVDMEISRS